MPYLPSWRITSINKSWTRELGKMCSKIARVFHKLLFEFRLQFTSSIQFLDEFRLTPFCFIFQKHCRRFQIRFMLMFTSCTYISILLLFCAFQAVIAVDVTDIQDISLIFKDCISQDDCYCAPSTVLRPKCFHGSWVISPSTDLECNNITFERGSPIVVQGNLNLKGNTTLVIKTGAALFISGDFFMSASDTIHFYISSSKLLSTLLLLKTDVIQ